MRKLAFYSDQIIPQNKEIDLQLLQLIGKPNPRIGFIPSCFRADQKHFLDRKAYYAQYQAELCLNFDLDKNFQPEKLPELLNCDAIHLSGGDTAYFLSWLYKRDLITTLRDYAAKGGVLIGVSAGALIMTDSIANYAFLENYHPQNTRTQGLGLADFAFYPHLNDPAKHEHIIKNHTLQTRKIAYACPDGSGILVNDVEITLIGEVLTYQNGKIAPSKS